MEFIQAKTLLSKVKFDNKKWFGIDYIMNIYKGCNHGCIYCDSRSDRYYIEDFDRVRGKIGIENILHNELRKYSTGVIGIGAMSDTYNSYEKESYLTQIALTKICEFGYGVSIDTKSNLITRDKKLIAEIANKHSAIIKFSITCAKDELSKVLEPYACPSSERFAAIRELSSEGIYVGVLLTPILPFITDDNENIKRIIHMAADNGAKFIYAKCGMTMSNGQREYYYNELAKKFPTLIKKYKDLFGYSYICDSIFKDELTATIEDECKKCNLLFDMEDIIDAYSFREKFKQLSFFEE